MNSNNTVGPCRRVIFKSVYGLYLALVTHRSNQHGCCKSLSLKNACYHFVCAKHALSDYILKAAKYFSIYFQNRQNCWLTMVLRYQKWIQDFFQRGARKNVKNQGHSSIEL